MAILALLARAGERGVSRDKLLALLWPDADDERGSRTLAQALYALRKDLVVEDAITGAKELRFDPAIVTSDVGEFSSAVSRGDDARAAELYTGPFLDGFHVSGADEFSRWVDHERAVLAQDYARTLESLARHASTRGNASESVDWWRKLAALEPLNARVAVGLMESLAAAGDRATAIKHARVYDLLVEQELDLPPDREVRALAERLRVEAERVRASEAPAAAVASAPAGVSPVDTDRPEDASTEAVVVQEPPVVLADAASPAEPKVVAVAPTPRPARRRSAWVAAAAGTVIVVAGLATLLARRSASGAPNDSPLVAVGRIVSYGTDSSTKALAGPVADLLATNLARSLRVVSAGRMLDLMRQTRTPGDTGAAGYVSAAQQAGATELIDGTLYTRPGGLLRLDLRRVDLTTGAIGQAYSVEGPDLFALVDSGTARLVAAHGRATPKGSIAGLTTHSTSAYRFYVEGLQMMAAGDAASAERLFAAALREDSTFAMAAFHYGLAAPLRVSIVQRMNLALRLSEHATDRERLMIRAGWAWRATSPEFGALADSLVRQYPDETEGHLYSGIARFQQGDFLGAIVPLRRTVAMDSLAFTRRGGAAGCNACIAMSQIVLAYAHADSFAAAEREARRWTRLQPGAATSSLMLWDILERSGKFTEALKVAERAAELDRDAVAAFTRATTHAMRTGDLVNGERMIRASLDAGNAAARREALWQLVLLLRYQARFTEAMDAARRYRAAASPLDSARSGYVSTAAAPMAVVLDEMGRHREAAALFDSISHWRPPDEPLSLWARERAWRLTLRARALASAGDIDVVAALADTIAAIGAQSGNARDRRLDRYVRGLVLLARNDLAGAEAAFRSAVFSWTAGYTRINCDLAQVLLRLGRPRDAIAVLQPALRGKIDTQNYYATYTEIHALLAQAWDAAGRPDSAATHQAWVARAWERGDPPYAERAAASAGRAR